jgi:hypothetical protein
MMKDGVALDSDEYVLRRVSHSQILPDGSLTRGAFTPNPNDTDGLSVYRELPCGGVLPLQLKAASRNLDERDVVVRLSVRDVMACGLSVVIKDDPVGLPGHCVIPEFNITAYKNKTQKLKWINVQRKLCELAERVCK